MSLRILLFVCAVAALSASLAGQAPSTAQPAAGQGPAPGQASAAPGLAFDVASIKRNISGNLFIGISVDAGQFTATNFPVGQLVQNAFQLQPNQLIGAPDWFGERYDIRAKIPEGVSPARQREMVRALLADRFRLVTHAETRELSVYALLPARGDGKLGPNLSPTKNSCGAGGRVPRGAGPVPGAGPAVGPLPPPAPGERPPCGMFIRPGEVRSGGVTMARLAEILSPNVGRTVVDRTGLTGSFDFDLTYAREQPQGPDVPGLPALPPVDPNAPSLFVALTEQLGLKLDSTRMAVEVIVIDRVERPTED